MKKLLFAVTLALASTASQAITIGHLSLNTDGSTVAFTGDTHDVITGATSGMLGQLSATQDTLFSVTFLGKEALNTNFYVSNGAEVVGSSTTMASVGDTFLFNVSAGVIDFGFGGSATTGFVSNLTSPLSGIAYIANNGSYVDASGNPFAFLIGFNDGGSLDGDFDDYVVGVSAVPVPAALPLLASALGMFGVARRRKTLA